MPWTVRHYRREDQADLFRLHHAWLSHYDLWEERDAIELLDPTAAYIDCGGATFVALCDEELAASVTMVPCDQQAVEVTKLAVAPEYQGQGLGRAMLDVAIEWARKRKAARVVLISNRRLFAALRLYESVGFRYEAVPADIAARYRTADLFMVLDLG